MYEAFLFYFEQGSARSLTTVAAEFKVGVTTVKRWSSTYSWQSRLIGLERNLHARMQKESESRVAKARSDSLKLLGANEARYAKEMKDNPERHLIQNMNDFAIHIKNKLLLLEGQEAEKLDTGITIITNVPEQDLD